MSKSDLLGNLKDLPRAKSSVTNTGEKRYVYRKNTIKERISATIDSNLNDKLERHAFHAGIEKSYIINSLLSEYYKDKDFDEIPEKESRLKL
jgi:hypothetical protein